MLYALLIGELGEGTALDAPLVRALLACLTAAAVCLVAGDWAIRWLVRLKVREKTEKTPIEAEALRRLIASKSGTPTMGGVLILAGLVLGCLAWADLREPAVVVCLAGALALGGLGMADDLGKLLARGHRSRGLKVRWKLLAQAAVGAGVGLALVRWAGGGAYTVPLLALGGAAFAAWAALVVTTMSNATNITDGLDGLLAGLTLPAALVLGLACRGSGSPAAGEAAVFCAALAGACMGFLWFNRHPARVFMGDTGALAIGGGLAAAALAAGQELLLGVVGLVFLVEFGSSLLQIGHFKLTGGRRILPRAPIHHIWQERGVPEPRVVRGFYLGGAAVALAALALLWI